MFPYGKVPLTGVYVVLDVVFVCGQGSGGSRGGSPHPL